MRLTSTRRSANPKERAVRSHQLIIDSFPSAAGTACKYVTGDGGSRRLAFEGHLLADFRPDLNELPGRDSANRPLNPHYRCLQSSAEPSEIKSSTGSNLRQSDRRVGSESLESIHFV